MLKRKYVDTVELQDRLFGKLNNGNPLEDELCKFFAAVVDETPPADVVEVRHGKWIGLPLGGNSYCRCSVCGKVYNVHACNGRATQKYCPHCGAKMDEEDNDE